MQNLVNTTTLLSLENALRGSPFFKNIATALLFIGDENRISSFPAYGCAIMYRPSATYVGKTMIQLIGLDNWATQRNCITGACNQFAACKDFCRIDVGEVFDCHIQHIKEYVKESLSNTQPNKMKSDSDQRKQKTPAYIECLLREAILMVNKPKEEITGFQPYVGTTDLERLTGGEPADITWLLMKAVLCNLVGEELLHHVVVTYYLHLIEDNYENGSSYEVMELLQETVDIITEQLVARYGCNVEAYLQSVERIMKKMDISAKEQAKFLADIYYVNYETNPPLPMLYHPVDSSDADAAVVTDYRNMALKAIGLIDIKPVINLDSPRVFRDVLVWCGDNDTSLLLNIVIEDLFLQASQNLARTCPELEEIQAMVDLKDIFLYGMKRTGLELETVCRSSRVLVEWICCCLVHRHCINTYTDIKHYNLPLDHNHLSVLCVDTKAKQDAILSLTNYIRDYSEYPKHLFHPSFPEHTFEYAKLHFSTNEHMKSRLDQEDVEVEQRRDAYWATVLLQKEKLKDLRAELYRLVDEISRAQRVKLDAEAQRDRAKRELDQAQQEYSASQSFKNQKWRSSYDAESKKTSCEIAYQREVDLCSNAFTTWNGLANRIKRLTSDISHSAKAPDFIVNPMPSNHEDCQLIIFFQEMPEALNILSNCVVSSYSTLTEPSAYRFSVEEKELYDEKTKPIPMPQPTWANHYNTYSKNRTVDEKYFLLHPIGHEIPKHYGIRSVDDMCHRLDSAIWFPNFNTTMTHSSLLNPFEVPPKFIRYFFTENSDILQFALDYPDEECLTDRGNMVYSRLQDIPESFTLVSLINLCSIRSFPNLQIRKLIDCLKGNSLPWSQKIVQDVIAMALYQIGTIINHVPLWKTDLWEHGLWNELAASLQERVEVLKETPRNHSHILALSVVARFHASYSRDLTICREMSVMAVAWARIVHTEFENRVNEEHQQVLWALRAKEALMFGYAVLCQADTLLSEDAGDLLKWIVQFHHIVAMAGEIEDSLVAVKESVEGIMARKIHVIPPLVDNLLLTQAFKEVVDVPEAILQWTRMAGSYCYESSSTLDLVQHFAINIFTGCVLVNGCALNTLEQNIINHNQYFRIFGVRNFEVVKTGLNVRRTRLPVNDVYHYEFITGASDELIIREILTTEGTVLELLDISKYQHELPRRLQELYTHWWARDKQEVHLRLPRYNDRQVKFIISLHQNKCFQMPLSIQSEEGCVMGIEGYENCPFFLFANDCDVAKILSKFERIEFIHCLRFQSEIIWELPRFQISFIARIDGCDGKIGQIQSREVIGFTLSNNQQLSAWTNNFCQYLVLENEFMEKKIIIPAGDVVNTERVFISNASSPGAHIEYYSYTCNSLTKDFSCSSVEARLHLACICAATSTALPDEAFDMTGTEYALKLLRDSWVHRPLHETEISKLDCLVTFSYREPAILLLCEDLLKQTSEISFLYDSNVFPTSSNSNTGDIRSAAAFQMQKEIMVPRKNIVRRGMNETELWNTILWKPPKLIRSEEMQVRSLPEPPLAMRFIMDIEEQLMGMVTMNKRLAEPFLLERSQLTGQYIDELRISQENFEKTPIYNSPDHIDISDYLRDVRLQKESMYDYIRECLNTAIDYKQKTILGLRRLVHYIPILKMGDVMRIAIDKEFALEFNPYLSNFALQQIFEAAVTLLCICVLESKLIRIQKGSTDLVMELRCVRQWDPMLHPYWVVFEAEGGIQIRPEQYIFAMHLLGNPGAISQLTMGSGKTRVVLPMIILEKLHKKTGICIPRITILSQIIQEASEYLHQSLTASVFNFKMITQPFGRFIKLDDTKVEILRRIELRYRVSFKVVAPEHRLSLHLKTIELASKKDPCTENLRKFLNYDHYIDILDESDVLLSHKYQLIYAVGDVEPLQHWEERSMIAQALLNVLNTDDEVQQFMKEFELALLDDNAARAKKGGFNKIIQLPIVNDDGRQWTDIRKNFRMLLFKGIVSNHPSELDWIASVDHKHLEIAVLDNSVPIDKSLMELLKEEHFAHLLSLRGFLASGILEAALEKRYRVNYGLDSLDPKRKKRIAIPFTAADVPSTRSDFSHPDITIVLTTLAYYYHGLSPAQLKEAIQVMLNLGFASREFHYNLCFNSVDDYNQEIDTVHKIDLSNEVQVGILYETFRYNTKLINFWLNTVVLRQDTGQYSERIVANAWDLSAHMGFSGTKDNHMLLPLHVHQLEPDDAGMRGADAKMASLISKKRVVNITHGWRNVLNEAVKYDALIDTGSLLAGVPMKEVVEIVRSKCLHRRGVAFFEDGWKVLDRSSGLVLPKTRSSLEDSECFVVFDEARCRGSDFKLASNAVGVITLGQGLCRDKFLQGAGRMRQLDRGQELVIVGTKDILRDSADALHVVEWVLRNTASECDRGKAEWATQGFQFHSNNPFVKEDWTLKTLYASPETTETLNIVAQRMKVVGAERIVERCMEFGKEVRVRNHEALEESERELQLEEEQQQEQIKEIPAMVPIVESSWDFATALSAQSVRDLATRTYQLGAVLPKGLGWESFPVYVTHNCLQTVYLSNRTSGEYINQYMRLASCLLQVGTSIVLLSDLEGNGILEHFWKLKQRITRFQTVQSWLDNKGVLSCLVGLYNGETNFPGSQNQLESLVKSEDAKCLLKDMIDMRGELHNWSCSDLQRCCDRTDYSKK